MATFKYLRNTGSPTQWDATDYFAYLQRDSDRIPAALQTIVDRSRFDFDRTTSFWHSDLQSASAIRSGAIELTFKSDNAEWLFGFNYSGVKRVSSSALRLYFMPSLVMQELVVLRGGLLRHAFSDLGGTTYVIHAESVSYWQTGESHEAEV